MRNQTSGLGKIISSSILSIPFLTGCSYYHVAGYKIEPSVIPSAVEEFKYIVDVIDTNKDKIISQKEADAAVSAFKEMGGVQNLKEKISGYLSKN